MPETKKLITGEFACAVDERYRLSLPKEFKEVFKPEAGKCVIVKEKPGHLSLWDEKIWKEIHDKRVEMVMDRLNQGRLGEKTSDLQRLGRLLSTLFQHVQLKERGRLSLPEGFREFLAVEPKQEAMIIGAWHCIEIWHPQKWIAYAEEDIPQFGNLMESLL
jgi:MraZ protein